LFLRSLFSFYLLFPFLLPLSTPISLLPPFFLPLLLTLISLFSHILLSSHYYSFVSKSLYSPLSFLCPYSGSFSILPQSSFFPSFRLTSRFLSWSLSRMCIFLVTYFVLLYSDTPYFTSTPHSPPLPQPPTPPTPSQPLPQPPSHPPPPPPYSYKLFVAVSSQPSM
jgi:hypothetical protein